MASYRANFLSTVLVPIGISPASHPEERECYICLTPLTEDAVLILCPSSHIFHRDCITAWLTTYNDCPLCKTVLFGNGMEPASVMKAQEANLLHGTDLTTLELFGTAQLSVSDISAEAVVARYFLLDAHCRCTRRADGQMVSNVDTCHHHARVRGPGIVHCKTQIKGLIVMANLLFAWAEVQGRPYTARQIEQWQAPIRHIINYLRKNEGQTMDVVAFARSFDAVLTADLERICPGAGGGDVPATGENLVEGIEVRTDFLSMMEYVAFLMWLTVQRPIIRKQRRTQRCAVM